jgi:hypothetical protein
MKTIPVYSSTSFNWKGNHGTTENSKLIEVCKTTVPKGWNGVAIQSTKTGKIALFNPVEDPSENGYDGEFMIYSHKDEVFVQIWIY